MSEPDGPLDRARAAARARAWDDAYRCFAELDRSSLGADDLETFADAAWWTTRLDESLVLRSKAYAAFVAAGENRRAAYGAWFLHFDHLWFKGNAAAASGWLRRAERHLDSEPDCVEHGYLAFAHACAAHERGELALAAAVAERAVEAGQRWGDLGLVALAVQELGHLLVAQGRVAEGTALLDEAMCSVLAGDLHPLVVGWVFCSLLITCFEMADLRRAAEWTETAVAWCESLPGTTPFHGLCRVHRAEVTTLQGSWELAESEARRAGEELLALEPFVAGEAFYAMGEVCRRRGRLADAEAAFRRADELGRDPQPGLALVRLAQGRIGDAVSALRLLSPAGGPPLTSARLMAAQVDVALAAGDLDAARTAAHHLAGLAGDVQASVVEATAELARAAVELAGGDSAAAVRSAERARTLWQDLRMPYEAAQARVLLGRARMGGGDDARGRSDLEAARAAFGRLGADLDVRHAAALLGPGAARPAGLSGREVEVLGLVAAGKTNREIASVLVLSEHTVSRHLQNVFTKLGVSSRAAAAAFAVEHGLT